MDHKISSKQSKVNIDTKNSKMDEYEDKGIEVQSNSRLTMERVFQKSKIKIEESYDPQTTLLFKDCLTEKIDIKKTTT